MMEEALSFTQVISLLEYVSHKMVESKELLSHADQAIGDGDHGIGMARGFEAVLEKLKLSTFSTYEDLFKNVGMTLLSNIGGAAGAIFGSLFIGVGKGFAGVESFTSQTWADALTSGLNSVIKRGGAKVGDKTMVDALVPAVETAVANVSEPLSVLTELSYRTAQKGMEKTKDYIATTGKAKTLSERSLGFRDPGAISTYLIFKFMNEFIRSL